MTLMDGLRAIGGYSPSVLDRIAASHPEPLSTGSMLMLRRWPANGWWWWGGRVL